MKIISNYILAAFLLLFVSCNLEDFSVSPEFTQKGDIQILGAAVDFDNKNVGTKALGSEENEESLITEMSMFIFDSNGDLVTERPVVINDYNTTPDAFMIEIGDENTQGIIGSLNGSVSGQLYKYDKTNGNLDKCKIYIVANAEHYKKTVDGIEVSIYEGIRTLGQLLDQTLPLTGFEMPRHNGKKVGFPMIGTTEDGVTFNLLDASQNQNKIATIPLRKLYSKVVVNMVINADQVVDEYIPKFELLKWSVKDSPTKVKFGADRMGYLTDTDLEYSQETNSATNQTIMHTASNIFEADQNDIISFTFYMPEHLVSVSNDYEYPDNISENEKQRFKPDRLANGQKATYVYIEGTYYDHHNQVKQVKYKLYLGQNNTDDFKVIRNQQLNNFVTIKGLTNSTSASGPSGETNISVDHRVEVTNEGFAIAMERETLMDAHFEVRPVDIVLSAGSSITVTVPESYRSWIGIEKSQETGNHVSGKGVRKYFTTDLISAITTNDTDDMGPVISYTNNTGEAKKYRFWVYVDENPNVYDKTGTGKTANEGGTHTVSTTESRLGKIQFVYNNTKTVNYNIEQSNLWRIWNGDKTRFYDIEYHEEYLYNYAADDLYGSTTDGMEWGLDGIQLSNKQKAAYVDKAQGFLTWFNSNFDDVINSVVEKNEASPYYDFYLTRDNPYTGINPRDFNGFIFNKEIIQILNDIYNNNTTTSDVKEIVNLDTKLNETPASAIAYCYNKNKRISSTGYVDMAENFHWYLPSIDEIEMITQYGYGDFEVFQNKLYWSCQPSFENNSISVKTLTSSGSGSYKADDTDRARATKINMVNNSPINVSSSADGIFNTLNVEMRMQYVVVGDWYIESINVTPTNNGVSWTNHEGNKPRKGSINRVRCVYRSGTN